MQPILSPAILERLERMLRGNDSPAIRGAEPGLSRDEIAGIAAGFPGELSAEAALWWEWRTLGGGGYMLPCGRYLPLEAAMDWYVVNRQYAEEEGAEPRAQRRGLTADDWWHSLWLPILLPDGGAYVVIDLSAPDGEAAPIREIDGQSFGTDAFDPIVAPSLAAYITGWLDRIDAGAYVHHPGDEEYWTIAPA